MRFRARTTLVLAGVTALTLGGAFAAVSVAFNGLQRKQLDDSLIAVAKTEAAEVHQHGLRFSDRPGPAANDIGPLTKFGIIYTREGGVEAATYPFERNPPPLAEIQRPLDVAFDFPFEHEHMRGVFVAVPQQPSYVLFLATSREDFEIDKAYLINAMLAAFAVAVGWASMVAYWMSGRLTRDHRNIAAAARSVARGDLTVRTDIRSRDPEVAQLGSDVNEMVQRLDELVSSQQRFIAHAAHELRSPLTALYGELQQALRKERETVAYRQAIQHALEATRRLNLLANDLLTLARTQRETAKDAEPIALASTVEEARSLVVDLAKAREVSLEVELSGGATVSHWHHDLTRLFRNLLENAISHSPAGSTVRVESRHDGNMLYTWIADEGPGIATADRERIFEPFFRTPSATRNREGSGLGLGIAREIARAHGGDVRVEDTPPPGARFLVVLPKNVATTK
ncbi:MAG TPA: HAMP domain-containing sensor histidine kinase [Polyangiaceae bacterium]|nr:HAMP domain-containing sensor histidine kinase [Polyangiaceae bacterium]